MNTITFSTHYHNNICYFDNGHSVNLNGFSQVQSYTILTNTHLQTFAFIAFLWR